MTPRGDPQEPETGQESVWDYPRPPRLEPSGRRVVVKLGTDVVADTTAAYRVLETSHPPSWYLPRKAVADGVLRRSPARGTVCEWKGLATYWDVGDLDRAAWSYQSPTGPFEAITGYVAFFPGLLTCTVDGEQVLPQPGGFYGGWITSDVVGPFKGGPGSTGW